MEKEELEHEIHETNILVRKLIRMQKYSIWLRLFYVFLILAVFGGLYLYIKPYVPVAIQKIIEKVYETQTTSGNFLPPPKNQ